MENKKSPLRGDLEAASNSTNNRRLTWNRIWHCRRTGKSTDLIWQLTEYENRNRSTNSGWAKRCLE